MNTGGGEGIPLYKPTSLRRPKGYGFLAFLGWKRVCTLPIMVWIRVGFSKELQERMNVFKP